MESMPETKSADLSPSEVPDERDDGRPTLRRRVIGGALMACVFGGAKWSQGPTADGVFWAVLALGFAIGWSGSYF
jgi:hypothetical protein